MFTRFDYSSEFDFEQDRDLIARFNEARDPAELSSIAQMSRQRLRHRRREARQRVGSPQPTAWRFAMPRARF